MTQTTKEIREAAERLYDWNISSSHPDRGKYGINPWRLLDDDSAYRERDKAIDIVCRFALEQTAGDGEQIDTDWLKNNWHWNDYGTMTLRAKTATAGLEITWNSEDGFSFCTHTNGMAVYTNPLVVTTRHQFRQLAQAINLTPKRKEKR